MSFLPSFPPRPTPITTNPYAGQYATKGLPAVAAGLRFAHDLGTIRLAKAILEHSKTLTWASHNPAKDDGALPAIVNLLLSLDDTLLELMLTRQMHKIFSATVSPSYRLPNDHLAPLTTGIARARCYALVHCNLHGRAPTKKQYFDTARFIFDYAREQDTVAKPWVTLDAAAKSLDWSHPRGSNWGGSLTTAGRVSWHTGALHPRRYAKTKAQKDICREWVKEIDLLLAATQVRDNDELPWSLVYIGWSSDDKARRSQHLRHENSSLKNLVEAVLAIVVAPQDSFLMRFIPLVPVTDYLDVGIWEHCLSILCTSYWPWAGLNGTMAGTVQSINKAQGTGSNAAWGEAVQTTLQQGVFTRKHDAMLKDCGYRRDLDKFWVPGSEHERAIRLKEEHEKGEERNDESGLDLVAEMEKYAELRYTQIDLEEQLAPSNQEELLGELEDAMKDKFRISD